MESRLSQLRSCMGCSEYCCAPLTAYVLCAEDNHQNQYHVGDFDKRIEFLTGCTGSGSDVVVTNSSALLWATGSYHLQAARELDGLGELWTLMKAGDNGVPSPEEWLSLNLPRGSVIGFDPNVVSEEKYLRFCKAFQFSGQSLLPVQKNLVDVIWNIDRKPHLRTPLVVCPLHYSGCSWQDKVAETRTEMRKLGVCVLVVTALDEIAWLLNVRGSDIEFDRVFYSYVIVTIDDIRLFVDDVLVTDEVRKQLRIGNTDGVQVYPYNDLSDHVFKLLTCKGKIWISSKSSQALCSVVPDNKRIDKLSPIRLMKALKNETELVGMRDANIRDSAILCEFLAWLDTEMPRGQVTEISAADKLETLRCELKLYISPSFATISSCGPNGAIPLYTPSPDTDRLLTTHEVYMCDSGGHYADGTTDVTRTVHFGTPTPEEKECFTLVLKSHIALSKSVFPENVMGNRLDSFARAPLWAAGLDYKTGTGHGVGASLCVVEDPPHVAELPQVGLLRANMVVTDEPGYYEEGRFGIRIENVCIVTPAKTKYNFGEKVYLGLQPITLVPIQLKMIDPGLLSQEEILWLNEYHAICRSTIGEYLSASGKTDVLQWLQSHTETLNT